MSASVIPARTLVHKATGKVISPFSALPFGSKSDDWQYVTKGFTIQWEDGTTGCGKPPFSTEAEAQAHIDRNPHFRGMGSY